MQAINDAFWYNLSGYCRLALSVGYYAQAGDGPAPTVLRVQGIGEYVVPPPVMAKTQQLIETLGGNNEQKLELFLTCLLDAAFQRVG